MKTKYLSAAEAISLIAPHSKIFVHGAAATPRILINELVKQKERLVESTLVHLHTEGDAPYSLPENKQYFRVCNLFVGHNIRKRLDYDRIDYLPCFLSEIPKLFREKIFPLNVSLLHVSPPDKFGFCSLGVSVDVAKAAAESSELVIAQVNPKMPRVHGDALIHSSQIHAFVEVDEALYISPAKVPDEIELKIAHHASQLIEDGSTLQMGIGSIPNAIALALSDRRNLGIHTEMWSDGALSLLEKGVVTNALKKVHRGKTVSGFLFGTQKLYDYVNDNPSVIQLEIDYVNNPTTIARNPKVVAINSAVEVDLTGQVCADSVGHRIISGVGGQMDFMRGAALSKGGKPLIAMRSTCKNGTSKIVNSLKIGSGVVTTRAHTHFVITEYGIASLFGKTLSQRAKALIDIAHPLHREQLEKDFHTTQQ